MAGQRQVLGEDHPLTQSSLDAMDRIGKNLAAEVAVVAAEEGEEEEQEEHETMYQRLAKRRRRG